MSQKILFEKSLAIAIVNVFVVVTFAGFDLAAADFDYCSITKKHTMCLKDVSL